MKKCVISLVSVLLVLTSYGQQVSLIYSTDLGKNCFIRVNPGKIYDNKFDVDLQVNWVSNEMQPVKDLNSVVCFEAKNIWINEKDFVTLASDEKVISFNSTKKITFNVSEEFLGDTIELKFPFVYAPSIAVASSAADQVEFSFKRPRTYTSFLALAPGEIIDKTAPTLTLLSPEGVNDGSKPIVEVPFVTVKVQASDFYGIKSVIVNNSLANLIEDSIYEVEVPLKVGYENRVVTVVTDNTGFTTQKEFAIECRKAYNSPQYMAAVGAAIIENAAEKTKFYADVDTGIPMNIAKNEMRYALIIGNEDYTTHQSGLESEMNVEFAIRDAETFKEYAQNVLTIPEANIIFLKDAKVLDMKRGLTKFYGIIKLTKGQGEFFVYYAGHGFPDEITKEPYLMPVDVSGSDLEFAIKLSDFYKKICETPSKRITVFLDACFSGGGREMGLLAARGVKFKPKENQATGNLIVFSASSGEQSSLPYKDKQHGIFTYYLLQKMKETQGNINYEQLAEYLNSTVSIRSLLVNNKEQSPQVNVSKDIVGGAWKNWKLIGE
ncbi:MAG: caspase family protein [Salinivirgaceae bacterium]